MKLDYINCDSYFEQICWGRPRTPLSLTPSPNTTGTLVLKPVANANGTATITVSVNDGQAQNNSVSRTFTVTVKPWLNDAPTLSPLPNLTLVPNTGPQSVALSGISAGPTNELQSLTITAVSSNPNLVPTRVVTYSSPDSTGSLKFRAAQNYRPTSTITRYTVNDGQNQNNTVSRTFTVTVNSGPSISSVPGSIEPGEYRGRPARIYHF